MIREEINYTQAEKSLNGRIISVCVNDKNKIINIHAPSGTQKKAAREFFFQHSIAHHLRHPTQHVVIAGDFNCVINTNDSRGDSNFSPALKNAVEHTNIVDTWSILKQGMESRYITSNAASRTEYTFLEI